MIILSQHLVPRDSESPAVPPNFAFFGGGRQKNFGANAPTRPPKLAPSLRQWPPVRLSAVGIRAFPVAAAQIWNSLPEHIVLAPTLQSFGRHLKKFLLPQSFCL